LHWDLSIAPNFSRLAVLPVLGMTPITGAQVPYPQRRKDAHIPPVACSDVWSQSNPA
jgi:hypothetical protein